MKKKKEKKRLTKKKTKKKTKKQTNTKQIMRTVRLKKSMYSTAKETRKFATFKLIANQIR